MVKYNYLHVILLFILLGASPSRGQNTIKTKEEQEIEAYAALNAQDYPKAYALFDKLYGKYPSQLDYEEKLGICCLYYPERKNRAIELFTDLRAKNKKSTFIEYSLGRAYHLNYKFDEALAILEPLVTRLASSKKDEDKAIVTDANLGILNCKNGKYLIQNKVIADIKNIGAPVNTEDYEYVPIITADESIMYFTYRGKRSLGGKQSYKLGKQGFELLPDSEGTYTEDIFFSVKNPDGSYAPPKPIETINTKGYEAAIAISPDGQNLFTFASSGADSGDIFMSKLNGETWEAPQRLNSNINTERYWEGSCSISADGRYLYFASERPGGLGGRDIWVSEKVDSDWGPAVNLGSKINTPYDEDAPFIHPDGLNLFFSSKGHMSIGGYDIMFSVKKDNDWTDPKSMGIPLNTTEDDSYYVINAKGDRGFFSSNRAGSGGFGNYDIYTVTPGILGDKPIVAVLKGAVNGDDKPVEAKIEVTRKEDQQGKSASYYANKSTGKYLMALTPGANYHFKVMAEGFETLEEDFAIGTLDKYMEQSKDFNLYSASVAAAKKIKEQAVADSLAKVKGATLEKEPVKEEVKPKENTEPKSTPKKEGAVNTPSKETGSSCSEVLPDLGPFKGKSLNNASDYQKLLEVAGNYCAKNMFFKIQIGAYRTPGNFKPNQLNGLGKIESDVYPDGLTRFTQKQFTTLKDAESHRQKVIAKGVKDAWIVVFVDGKRYTLEDFVMVDFLGKGVN